MGFAFFAHAESFLSVAGCGKCQTTVPTMALKLDTWIPQKILCEPGPIGKPTVVDWDDRSSPSTVHHKYRLTRSGPKSWIVDLNMKFVSDSWWNWDDRTDKVYREKVQKCFDQANPYLKGPDGEDLSLRLWRKNPSDRTRSEPPEVKISIHSGNHFRSNATQYAADIDCPTMIHETMHLLGLADEYDDETRGHVVDPATGETRTIKGYDCRALAPRDSIMYSAYDAFSAIRPSKEYTVRACGCYKEIKTCLNEVSHVLGLCHDQGCGEFAPLRDQDVCPPGYRRETVTYMEDDHGKWRYISPFPGKDRQFFTWKGMAPIRVKAAQGRPSLLYPAQFRAIVFPGCLEKNELYYQCSRNAYRSSERRMGQKAGCADVSSECQKGGWLQ